MSRFATSTPEQINVILSGFFPAPLTPERAAARDYALAQGLDKKGDEYAAAGNLEMAAVCRRRALGACQRADRALGK